MSGLEQEIGVRTYKQKIVPIANFIYLPLAYLGGLWVPPVAMPAVISTLSQWTPTRAMGELSWAAVNGTGWDPVSVIATCLDIGSGHCDRRRTKQHTTKKRSLNQ